MVFNNCTSSHKSLFFYICGRADVGSISSFLLIAVCSAEKMRRIIQKHCAVQKLLAHIGSHNLQKSLPGLIRQCLQSYAIDEESSFFGQLVGFYHCSIMKRQWMGIWDWENPWQHLLHWSSLTIHWYPYLYNIVR